MTRQSTIDKYVGRQFNRWTVESFSHKESTHHYVFNCRCACGTMGVVRASALVSGQSKSCGCLTKERTVEVHTGNTYRRLAPGEAACNHLFKRYQADAAKRGIPFRLTREQFGSLTSSACYYCERESSMTFSDRNGYGSYQYNGIDRVDNAIGYLPENCVPCCKTCNSIKNAISKDMVFKIYEFLIRSQVPVEDPDRTTPALSPAA